MLPAAPVFETPVTDAEGKSYCIVVRLPCEQLCLNYCMVVGLACARLCLSYFCSYFILALSV
jgi:hypothetical protein